VTTRDWIRVVLFWTLMVFLALVWIFINDKGRGTTWDYVVAFGPLVGVAMLFVVVMAYDRVLKRRREQQGSK
jgi:positive regulator of sigma E activity